MKVREREDALRRLGGPDVGAERRKNAMNGDQKALTLTVMFAAAVIGFGIQQFAAYHMSRAGMQPTTDEILSCVNACSRSCAAGAEAP